MIEHYEMLQQDAYLFAMTHIVPGLVKQLLSVQDDRSLLQLNHWNGKTWLATPEANAWHAYTDKLSIKAQVQVTKISNAGYSLNEVCAMMLEQGDYWVRDLPDIIRLAVAYLNLEFHPKERRGAW